LGIGRFGPYGKICEQFYSIQRGKIRGDRYGQAIGTDKRKTGSDASIKRFEGKPVTKSKEEVWFLI